jgi:predicted regulator of Ras-like GTPase activity (Roadblock/LC7/MglB family)
MNVSNNYKLNKELKRLEAIGGIIGTAIVNKNGLLVFSNLPGSIDERKFGANAATMFDAIETAINLLKNEIVNNMTVEFNDCQIIALGAGEQLILVTLIELNVNMGLILIELEEIIKTVKKIVGT